VRKGKLNSSLLLLTKSVGYSLFVLLVSYSLSGCTFGDQSKLKIGMIAPSLKTKTLKDVNGDFSRITSYRFPDERMYQVSVDDALKLGKPIILEFATPGHCTVCDKQLQVIKGLMDVYGDDVLFIHIDQYFNPEAFIAYEVKGDPWTFVIDKTGKVVFRQAGRMLYFELDARIKAII